MKNLEEQLKPYIRDCKNDSTIFNTDKWIKYEDVLKVANSLTSDKIKVDDEGKELDYVFKSDYGLDAPEFNSDNPKPQELYQHDLEKYQQAKSLPEWIESIKEERERASKLIQLRGQQKADLGYDLKQATDKIKELELSESIYLDKIKELKQSHKERIDRDLKAQAETVKAYEDKIDRMKEQRENDMRYVFEGFDPYDSFERQFKEYIS